MSRLNFSKPISVVIPTYNESKWIGQCVESLLDQSLRPFEILVVDDGSTDDTIIKIEVLQKQFSEKLVKLFKQKHKGPGEARNLAAQKAKGEILLFIDADMTFEKNFIKKVIAPINEGKTIGTDSQSGKIANNENYWARAWNLGKFVAAGNFSNDYLTELTPNKRNYGGIFRAILKKEFTRVGGFETGGDYTDDASLANKLQEKAKIVPDSLFFHWNPDTIEEVWMRARWIGAGKNFTGTTEKKIKNLIKFCLPASIVKGIIIGKKFDFMQFVFFKIVYDQAVWVSVLKSI